LRAFTSLRDMSLRRNRLRRCGFGRRALRAFTSLRDMSLRRRMLVARRLRPVVRHDD
jgi:hypothetical protein